MLVSFCLFMWEFFCSGGKGTHVRMKKRAMKPMMFQMRRSVSEFC